MAKSIIFGVIPEISESLFVPGEEGDDTKD